MQTEQDFQASAGEIFASQRFGAGETSAWQYQELMAYIGQLVDWAAATIKGLDPVYKGMVRSAALWAFDKYLADRFIFGVRAIARNMLIAQLDAILGS